MRVLYTDTMLVYTPQELDVATAIWAVYTFVLANVTFLLPR